MNQYPEQLDQEALQELLSSGTTFVWDVSALVSSGYFPFLRSFLSLLKGHDRQMLVPGFYQERLTQPDGKAAYEAVRREAFRALNVPDYGQLFNALSRVLKITELIAVVNDDSRKKEILDARKESGIFVHFYTLTDQGVIKAYPRHTANPQKPARREQSGGFTIRSTIEDLPMEPLPVNRQYGLGDYLLDSSGRQYRMESQVASHQNALTFRTSESDIYAKVFAPSALNTFLEAKIRRMLTQKIDVPGLCWPIDVLTNRDGTFVGYITRAFRGYPMYLSLFRPSGLQQYFPDWTRLELCRVAQSMLTVIEALHRKNVLLGCLNPAAIWIESPEKVYFLNTDDYQVEGFPTLTYNVTFTPPELLDKPFYFATLENENYAVAELVFMTMMPGKNPYSIDGDMAPADMIRQMKFPYSKDWTREPRLLPGIWRMAWSHMDSLGGAFFNTFQKDRKFNAPADRGGIQYWRSALSHYEKYLQDPDNRDSLPIFPKTFKRRPGETYYECIVCHNRFPRAYFKKEYFGDFNVCNGCLGKQSNVSFTCVDCGRTYYYDMDTAIYHKKKKMEDPRWKNQKHCDACKRKKLPCVDCGRLVPYYTLSAHGRCKDCGEKPYTGTGPLTCRDCHQQFYLTYSEAEHYHDMGWDLPSRCKSCRSARKNSGGSGNRRGGRSDFYF